MPQREEKYTPFVGLFGSVKLRCRCCGGAYEVFSPTRRRWLVLTPEEWVRQHCVEFLRQRFSIPPALIVEEYPVLLNGQNQRADVVIFSPQQRPWMLVECKAADVAIDQGVLAQAVRYNSVVGAEYILLTNGLDHRLYDGATHAALPLFGA